MAITELPPSPNGELSHGQVREKVNEVISTINAGSPGFVVFSDANALEIPTDNTSPGFLANIIQSGLASFEIFDAATGAVKYTGVDPVTVVGSVSVHITKSGIASSILSLYSETSTDEGVSYNLNNGSLRQDEVGFVGDGWKIFPSFLQTWNPNEIIRFRHQNDGGGDMDITTTSTTSQGEVVTGHSIVWALASLATD